MHRSRRTDTLCISHAFSIIYVSILVDMKVAEASTQISLLLVATGCLMMIPNTVRTLNENR